MKAKHLSLTWHLSLALWLSAQATHTAEMLTLALPASAAVILDVEKIWRAAVEGSSTSQTLLAGVYFEGKQGVATNRVEGYKWALIAARSGLRYSNWVLNDFETRIEPQEKSQGKALAEAYLTRQSSNTADTRNAHLNRPTTSLCGMAMQEDPRRLQGLALLTRSNQNEPLVD